MTKEKNDDFIMRPTVDFCFKELMKNQKVLRGFVAVILRVSPQEIQDVQLLPTELERDSPDDKLGILDVRVQMQDGTQIDIEMQVRYFEYWDERSMFYLCKMFYEQMKKGDSYEKLEKCIHVSILDFVHFSGDDRCYRSIHLRDDATGELYSDKLEFQIMELKKIPKELPEGNDVFMWMKFFSSKNKEEFEAMAKTNEYLDEAYVKLVELSADEKTRLQYELREKALRDYNSQMNSAEARGLKAGQKRGEKIGEERLSALLQRLLENERIDDISKVTADAKYREKLYQEFDL